MEKIRIKCPVCGVILETLDNPANYEKNVTCPNCKTRNRFSSYKRLAHAPSASANDSTIIKPMIKDSLGTLTDTSTGRKYSLKKGRNIIGRMTYKTPPVASIPIETSNRRMSRSHLFIDIIEGADGRFHAYASNASNRNATTINGKVLNDGDMVSLRNLDILSLADTNMVYEGSVVEDDTIILAK